MTTPLLASPTGDVAFGTFDPDPDQSSPEESPTMPRGQHEAQPSPDRKGRIGRGVRQALTFITWLISSALSASGMWYFMYHKLHMTETWMRAAGFAIFEIAMLTSGLRARALRLKTKDAARWNADSIAVWAFALATGAFSASDTTTVPGAAARIVIALLAGWMLERLIAEERAAKFSGKRAGWVDRLLVKLGLSDPSKRSLEQVDAARRLARLATLGYRALTVGKPGSWRRDRAVDRYRRALARANERIGISTDPDKMATLRASVALLTEALDRITPGKVGTASPWAAAERADKQTRQAPDNDRTGRQTTTGQADQTTDRTGGRTDRTSDRTGRQAGGRADRTANRTADQTNGGPPTGPDQTNGHGRTAIEDARLLRQRWPHTLPDGANSLVRRPEADGGFGWGGTKSGNAIKAYLDGADQTDRPSGLNGTHGPDRTGLVGVDR